MPDHERLSVVVPIRLKPKTYDAIEARLAPGQSVGSYLRDAAINAEIPPPVPAVSQVCLDVLREYGRRINEAAHAANQGLPVNITPRELAELKALLLRIKQQARGED